MICSHVSTALLPLYDPCLLSFGTRCSANQQGYDAAGMARKLLQLLMLAPKDHLLQELQHHAQPGIQQALHMSQVLADLGLLTAQQGQNSPQNGGNNSSGNINISSVSASSSSQDSSQSAAHATATMTALPAQATATMTAPPTQVPDSCSHASKTDRLSFTLSQQQLLSAMGLYDPVHQAPWLHFLSSWHAHLAVERCKYTPANRWAI